MTDQDLWTLAFLLFVVIAVMLLPPGPGTPLPDRVPASK